MQQVQISKVNGRTCRDSFGRELVRIGNMNVNAGDIVWTDGRCVYGSIRQGSPANPLTFIRGGEEPGIPLNTKYGLLIYTRGHRLYRWGNAKQRALLNNANKYSLNSRIGASIGISDVDISSEGKTWEINPNAHYAEADNSHWLYNGIDLSKYWLPRNETCLLMSIRDLPTNHFKWNIGNKQNTVEQIIGETTTNERTGCVLYNGQVTQTLSAQHYAKYGKSQVQSLLSQVGGSSKFQSTTNCRATISGMHIDEKGNWCGFVDIQAWGTTYKDYLIQMKIGIFWVNQISPYNVISTVHNTNNITLSQIYTVAFTAYYNATWWVENGEMVMPVYEWKAITPNESYIDAIDRRTIDKTKYEGGKYIWDRDWSSFLEGVRSGTNSTKMSEHIKITPFMSSTNKSSCFVPIQDDFAYKSIEGMPMTDNTTVYKNGAVLFEHPGGVNRVTALNEDKGEFVFTGGGSDSGVYVVRGGKIKPILWKGKPIYPNNWRLRYMNNLSDLRRDETKIP